MFDDIKDRPLPTRVPLPTGVKVLGWLALLAGTWNAICACIAALATPVPGSVLARLSATHGLLIIGILGAAAALSGLGLLMRQEWGRVCATGCLFALFCAGLSYAIWSTVISWPTSGAPFAIAVRIVALVIALAAATIPAFLAIRYLRSEKVRNAFS